MNTIKSHLIEKTYLLKKNFIDVPKLEARLLLAKVLNKNLDWTYSNLEKEISKKNIVKYNILIRKRIKGIPIAYLLGTKEFYSMLFKVNQNTLIPRPETETIIDEIKKKFKKKDKFSVLDLGTGSGCILLTIIKEFKNAKGIGVDKFLKTLKVAKDNCQKFNFSRKAKFINLDWNNNFFVEKILNANEKNFQKKKFDLIVSNPPYLLKNEMKNLMAEVNYEPKDSLYDNKDGLNFYKRIIPKISFLLSNKGFAIIEINPKKFKSIREICLKNEIYNFNFIKDFCRKKRFILIKN